MNRQRKLGLGVVLMWMLLPFFISAGHLLHNISLFLPILPVFLILIPLSGDYWYYKGWMKCLSARYGATLNETDYAFPPYFKSKREIKKGKILSDHGFLIMYENGFKTQFGCQGRGRSWKDFKQYDEIAGIYPCTNNLLDGFQIDIKDCTYEVITEATDRIGHILKEKLGEKWEDIFKKNMHADLRASFLEMILNPSRHHFCDECPRIGCKKRRRNYQK